MSKTSSNAQDALCFCEYDDVNGQRNHILATCCDCEALDSACDRCITCRGVPNDTCDRLCATVEDRCRVPWKGGAIRVRLDIVLPAILMPCSVLIASASAFWTVVAAVGTLAVLVSFYRVWRRQAGRKRTRAFFVFGIISVLQMYYTYITVVVAFREVLLWETLLLSTLFALLLFSLYHARRDPGSIPATQAGEAERSHNSQHSGAGTDEHGLLTEYEVAWADSRPIKNGLLVTWCDVCHVHQPPRAAHCSFCNICVRGRDHHCIWIDTCVGAGNHREFFFALVLFVVTGCYGAHLTMTTICTPEMYLGWFLWPNDCRFVYSDFPTAVSFISACYTYVAVAAMLIVLVQQILLISQNLTLVELRHASARGWTWHWCPLVVYRHHNANDGGIYRNWRDFLSGSRRQRYAALSVPV